MPQAIECESTERHTGHANLPYQSCQSALLGVVVERDKKMLLVISIDLFRSFNFDSRYIFFREKQVALPKLTIDAAG